MRRRSILCPIGLAFAVFVLRAAAAEAQEYGIRAIAHLRGSVISQVDAKPLADVAVVARRDGEEHSAKTDAGGQFVVDLGPGVYRIVFSYAGFADRTFETIEIKPGTVKQVNVSMRPKTAAANEGVEEIVVTGRNAAMTLEQARFGDSVVDVLNAEDFAVTGDSDVTEALARVTGVTIVDDKYVYVRGLGERYSSTLLNGSLLPSPEPTRRVVPLDLFPSGVMEQLSVEKTYSPSLPADFSGGSLQMTTRAIPKERQAALSFSTEYNSQTTFKRTRWYEGDSLDGTGFEGGFRRFPGKIKEVSGAGPLALPSELSDEDLRDTGLSLNRHYDTSNITIRPNFTLNASYGNGYDLPGGRSVGILGGLRYKNNWQFTEENRRTSRIGDSGKPPDYAIADDLAQKRTESTIGYAGLGALEWTLNDTQLLRGTLFFTRVTDKRYIEEEGHLHDTDRFVLDNTWEWEERQLWSAQLVGDHTLIDLADLEADWGVTFSMATRSKPDTRFFEYTRQTSSAPYAFSNAAAGNRRQWEDLQDDAWDVYLNLQLPLRPSENIFTTFKAGMKYFDKQRDSSLRAFRFLPAFSAEDFENLAHQPLDDVFDDGNIGRGKWELLESTNFSDSYKAEEEIIAGYLQADNELWTDWRYMVGLRYETSAQETDTRNVSGGGAIVTQLEKAYLLPAMTLTWEFRDDMQLRGAFSQTINRPDLREISSACYLDPETRKLYCGNPSLQIAEIKNYDLMWDWFYHGEDSLSLGAFYKDLTSPIEVKLDKVGSGSSLRRSYINAETGSLWGIEVSERQSFEPLGSWARDFYCKLNGAYINSEVEVDPTKTNVTNPKHRLQGQSDWIVNAQLTWDNLERDTQATLVFNMAGDRIADIGAPPFDDAIEQSVPVLDFVASHGFQLWGQFLRFEFKAKNLIDPEHVEDRSGIAEREYTTGRSVSFSLEADF